MKRQTFLLIAAIGQLFFGIFFLFFSEAATAQSMKETATETTLLFVKNLGGFQLGVGMITLLCRKSPDTLALRAILIGTLVYLVASVSIDAYGILAGFFTPQGWGGIVARVLFIVGYIYYLAKMKIEPAGS